MEYKNVSIRMPMQTYNELTEQAARNLWSVNKTVVVAIDKYNKAHTKKGGKE